MSAIEISTKPSNTTFSPYTSTDETAHTGEVAKRPSNDLYDSQYWRYDVPQKRLKSGAADGDKQCFKFIYSGSCPRGEKCNFQHDMDAREQHLRGVCLDFLIKGKCERGPDCNFKHSLQSEGEYSHHRRRSSENANANRSRECWFCLSSPNFESHLIISVGESYYCALPKGPLIEDHVLLIPIEHSPNTLSLSQESELELVGYQKSLKLYYKNRGKEAVSFEWVSNRVSHANLQVVPVPSSRAAAIQNIFNLAAEKLGFKFVAMQFDNYSDGRKWLRTQFERSFSFFYVELPNSTILAHSVEENDKFPVQFGREVLAGLLKMPEKANWRNCALNKDEETKMAEEFKKRFEELDPAK